MDKLANLDGTQYKTNVQSLHSLSTDADVDRLCKEGMDGFFERFDLHDFRLVFGVNVVDHAKIIDSIHGRRRCF